MDRNDFANGGIEVLSKRVSLNSSEKLYVMMVGSNCLRGLVCA